MKLAVNGAGEQAAASAALKTPATEADLGARCRPRQDVAARPARL